MVVRREHRGCGFLVASHREWFPKLRQERHHRRMSLLRGWRGVFLEWSYKYAAPDGAGEDSECGGYQDCAPERG